MTEVGSSYLGEGNTFAVGGSKPVEGRQVEGLVEQVVEEPKALEAPDLEGSKCFVVAVVVVAVAFSSLPLLLRLPPQRFGQLICKW